MWEYTGINLCPKIYQTLNKEQYLYLEEFNKLLIMGIPDISLTTSSFKNKTLGNIDTPGDTWYLVNLCEENRFSLNKDSNIFQKFPEIPVPKTQFWTTKIGSFVFLIGGNDEKETWFCIDIL